MKNIMPRKGLLVGMVCLSVANYAYCSFTGLGTGTGKPSGVFSPVILHTNSSITSGHVGPTRSASEIAKARAVADGLQRWTDYKAWAQLQANMANIR